MHTILVPATDVVVGTYLGPKTVVTKRHPRTDIVMVATHSRGARSGSVAAFENDDMVRVWIKN